MFLNAPLPLLKTLPLLISLLVGNLFGGAVASANEVEASQTSQAAQSNDASSKDALSKDILLKSTESKPVLQNPNAALVAMAFKFNRVDGSPNSYAEVVAGYCKKAKTGDADALFALAWMYENGRGVTANKNIAAQLYNKAAEQGHSSAQQSLARFTDVQPATNPLTCLLPDPPVVKASIEDANTNANEQKAISDKTAALFYSQRSVFKLVNKLAPKYKIDANLAMAFIAVESNFNALATSPKNAQGLMQLIPETAERFGVKDAYKAEDNIKGGLAYLRWLLAYYKGDVELVAAAYNAGEGTVDKYKGVPPYPETRLYVKKIASLYNNLTHPYQDDFVKGSRVDSFSKKKVM
jgi:soluble lytic murein transglycosylase-like protein